MEKFYFGQHLLCQKLDEKAKLPTVAYPAQDLGYDVYALDHYFLNCGNLPIKVRTGIAVHAKGLDGESLGLIVKDRSSLASQGVFTHGGVIDSTYRGEIIILMTYSPTVDGYRWSINPGDKIAQLVPVHVLTGSVHEDNFTIDESSRGVRGFGSTGIK